MGTIPTPPTFVAGTSAGVTAQLNTLRDCVNFWALTPRTYAYLSSAQTLATSTYVAVGMAAEVYDIVQSGDSASHDAATNNTRLYVRTTGKYQVTAQLSFASNATGTRSLNVRSNAAGNQALGTSLMFQQIAPVSGSSTIMSGTIEVPLTAGDYIEVFARQSSGGNLDLNSGQDGTFLQMKLTGS